MDIYRFIQISIYIHNIQMLQLPDGLRETAPSFAGLQGQHDTCTKRGTLRNICFLPLKNYLPSSQQLTSRPFQWLCKQAMLNCKLIVILFFLASILAKRIGSILTSGIIFDMTLDVLCSYSYIPRCTSMRSGVFVYIRIYSVYQRIYDYGVSSRGSGFPDVPLCTAMY